MNSTAHIIDFTAARQRVLTARRRREHALLRAHYLALAQLACHWLPGSRPGGHLAGRGPHDTVWWTAPARQGLQR